MFWKTCFFMHCKWTLWRHTGSSHIYGNIHASILGEQLETILGFRNSECGIFLGGQFSNSRCCMYVRTVLIKLIEYKSYSEHQPALSMEKGCKNPKEALCMSWINPVIFTDCEGIYNSVSMLWDGFTFWWDLRTVQKS